MRVVDVMVTVVCWTLTSTDVLPPNEFLTVNVHVPAAAACTVKGEALPLIVATVVAPLMQVESVYEPL